MSRFDGMRGTQAKCTVPEEPPGTKRKKLVWRLALYLDVVLSLYARRVRGTTSGSSEKRIL